MEWAKYKWVEHRYRTGIGTRLVFVWNVTAQSKKFITNVTLEKSQYWNSCNKINYVGNRWDYSHKRSNVIF